MREVRRGEITTGPWLLPCLQMEEERSVEAKLEVASTRISMEPAEERGDGTG